MKDNIILIGFMGSGKTTVGIRLSYALKRSLIDTDKWIENKEGKTVSAIFAEQGEEAFRDMETGCLKRLLKSENHKIISTGGGLPMREENIRLLKELGRVIYLKVTPELVYERLRGDTTRPLLRGPDPLQTIRELLAQREERYLQGADMVIEVSGKTFEDIIREIKRSVGE